MRTPIKLPEKTLCAILTDYQRIMGVVRPWAAMARPPRADRHQRPWQPVDGTSAAAGDEHLEDRRRFRAPGYRRLPAGGGKPRDAVAWTAVDLLAVLYHEHTGRRPGSGETGPFPELVEQALGCKDRDVRKLIRQVLSARRKALKT